MSVYNLVASPQVAENHSFWSGAFSEEEIYKIRSIGDSKVAMAATLDDGGIIDSIRRAKVAWLRSDNECVWIYDKLGYIVRQLNGQFFQFDITGFSEDLQYTTYESSNQGHYDFHMDGGFNQSRAPRKLSMVLQLSSPEEYEGGDLEFFTGATNIEKANKELGIVYAFPSYILHRVTPVTKGVRRSLVVWLSGPRFK